MAVNLQLCVVTAAAADHDDDDDDDRSVFCFDGFASFGVDVVDCGRHRAERANVCCIGKAVAANLFRGYFTVFFPTFLSILPFSLSPARLPVPFPLSFALARSGPLNLARVWRSTVASKV